MGKIASSVKVGDADVAIQQIAQADGSILVIAECNGHSESHVMTLGSHDEPLPDGYDLAVAQADLAAAVDRVSKLAASGAKKRELLAQLIPDVPAAKGEVSS
jgi:hypothetical protein